MSGTISAKRTTPRSTVGPASLAVEPASRQSALSSLRVGRTRARYRIPGGWWPRRSARPTPPERPVYAGTPLEAVESWRQSLDPGPLPVTDTCPRATRVTEDSGAREDERPGSETLTPALYSFQQASARYNWPFVWRRLADRRGHIPLGLGYWLWYAPRRSDERALCRLAGSTGGETPGPTGAPGRGSLRADCSAHLDFLASFEIKPEANGWPPAWTLRHRHRVIGGMTQCPLPRVYARPHWSITARSLTLGPPSRRIQPSAVALQGHTRSYKLSGLLPACPAMAYVIPLSDFTGVASPRHVCRVAWHSSSVRPLAVYILYGT